MTLAHASELAVLQYQKKYPIKYFTYSRATFNDMLRAIYSER